MASEMAERNRRIVERFIAGGVLEGRLDVIDDLCDPGVINHAAVPFHTGSDPERVLTLASDAGVPMRLLGGVAVRLHADELPPALDRQYKDLDFAVTKKGASAADQVLKDAGYEPHVSFNAMHARERGLYFDDAHGRQVDLFVHAFRMCHEITLGDRLEVDAGGTVPLAELLLTKLQIIEVNEKDIRDMVLLLHGLTGPLADQSYTNVMVPMGAQKDDWIAAVGSYIRNSFGNTGAMISPADVARVRAASGTRKAPWVLPELEKTLPAMIETQPAWNVTASHNQPAAQKPDPHHLEIVGRHGEPLGARILGGIGTDLTFDVESPAVEVAAHRDLAGNRRRFDARQRPGLLEHAILKRHDRRILTIRLADQ